MLSVLGIIVSLYLCLTLCHIADGIYEKCNLIPEWPLNLSCWSLICAQHRSQSLEDDPQTCSMCNSISIHMSIISLVSTCAHVQIWLQSNWKLQEKLRRDVSSQLRVLYWMNKEFIPLSLSHTHRRILCILKVNDGCQVMPSLRNQT